MSLQCLNSDAVGFRLSLAPYVVLAAIALIGRHSRGSRAKMASPDVELCQSCNVEPFRASPNLPSDACWVASRWSMPCRRKIHIFATVRYPSDGTPGQSASHIGKNLMMDCLGQYIPTFLGTNYTYLTSCCIVDTIYYSINLHGD
jgi:hypothetical protein